MTELQQRIVTEAERWVGTPYHHQGDVCGPRGGVDCAMLLVRVFVDLGLIPPFDPRPYPVNFYLHSDEPRYMGWVEKFGDPVAFPERGDVATFQFGRVICHGGIYVGDDLMIHAYQQAGRVEKTEITQSPMFAKRFKGFWRIRWPSM